MDVMRARAVIILALFVLVGAGSFSGSASGNQPQPIHLVYQDKTGGVLCFTEDSALTQTYAGTIAGGQTFEANVNLCQIACGTGTSYPPGYDHCPGPPLFLMAKVTTKNAKALEKLSVETLTPSGLSRGGPWRCWTPPDQRYLPELNEGGLYTVRITANADVQFVRLDIQVYDEYAWAQETWCPRQDWNFPPPAVGSSISSSSVSGLVTIPVSCRTPLLLGEPGPMTLRISGPSDYTAGFVDDASDDGWSFRWDTAGLRSGVYTLTPTYHNAVNSSADVGDYAGGVSTTVIVP